MCEVKRVCTCENTWYPVRYDIKKEKTKMEIERRKGVIPTSPNIVRKKRKSQGV